MISTPQPQFLSSPITLTPPNLLLFSSHPFTQPTHTTLFVPSSSSTTPRCSTPANAFSSSPMKSPSSLQLLSSSSFPELPPTQPMAVDTDDVVPPCSSLRVEGQLPSIQVHPPETSGVNSCMHEVECDSNLEIIDELRKAQARVRFLKKKLRQRGISYKRDFSKQSSRNQHLFSASPEATDLLTTQVPLDEDSSILMKERTQTFLGGNMREKNSRKKLTVRRILRRKDLQERENSESGEYVQGSTDSEMAAHCENSESKTSLEKGLEREDEDLMDKIFKMKNSETFQEQMHWMDILNHLNSQYNVNAPNSNMWDCKLCILQGPEGRCSNGCSSMEGLVSESSTLWQELMGDWFGHKSHTNNPFSSNSHVPLIDALGPVYSQSTATTLLNPKDEGCRLSYLQSGAGYFKCSFRQEFPDGLNTRFTEQGLMISNLAAETVLDDSDLLLHQNTAVDLLESSNPVSEPIAIHESLGSEHFSLQTSGEHSAETQLDQTSFILHHQYHEADLLDSSYFDSKQIMEQQNPAETSKLCGSDFLLHQHSANSMMHSRYVAGFDYECPSAQQYSLQTSAEGLFYGGITECKSGDEIWKQEPFEEQRLMEDLLADKLCAEDETFALDRFDFSC